MIVHPAFDADASKAGSDNECISKVALGVFVNIDGLTALAGLLVGTIVGITGVGGGALMTPILVLVFGIAPQTAVGTDLLYASIT